LKTKSVVTVIVVLCFIVLLSAINLIWKFSISMGFNDMNIFGQISVVSSIIAIVFGILSIIMMIVRVRKSLKKEHE